MFQVKGKHSALKNTYKTETVKTEIRYLIKKARQK